LGHFDWDEPSGRSHHVGYAPESDLIAASPRNEATGQYRKSTGSNNAAKLPAGQQHLRLNDLRKFRCRRNNYPPGPGTKHRTVRSPFK
jgi:hypothetical protein